MWKTLTLITFSVAVVFGQVPPYNETCERGKYPPPASRKVPTYVLDLNQPPELRWYQITKDKSAEIKHILEEFKKFVLDWGPEAGKAIAVIDDLGPGLVDKLPQPYSDEIRGIANATGLELGEIALYNIFYEVFTVCTSIVAQDPSGHLYHARNLDFGLFMGWDIRNNSWEITEALRPAIINVDYQKAGKTVFKAVHFAGYVGILTAVKPNYFTLSMNERFNADGGYLGLIQWILTGEGTWMGFLTRDVMENAVSFDDARDRLANTLMIAPAYFILGGNKTGEACVITRNREVAGTDIWQMKTKKTDNWYILETNYDHWKAPFFLDDRRTPAENCMGKLTQKSVGIDGIFDVLSSKPVLNKLTTYSALMQVNSGHLETWLQYCEDPCVPW